MEKKTTKDQLIAQLKKVKILDWATYCSWADDVLGQVSNEKTKKRQKVSGEKHVHPDLSEEFKMMSMMVWHTWSHTSKRQQLRSMTYDDISEVHNMVLGSHLYNVLSGVAENQIKKRLAQKKK